MSQMKAWLSAPAWILALVACTTCPDVPSIAVVVFVEDESGGPIDDAEVECAFEDEPFGPCGAGQEPGRYTVRVTRGDQVVEREVDVPLGGSQECNLPDTQYVTIVLPDESEP